MLPTNSPPIEPNPAADLEFLRQALPKEENPIVKELSKHIDKIWQKNHRDFKPTRQNMLKILRRVRGEYEPDKLAAIRAFKGSEAYFRSGENKARAAESWMLDIYQSDVDIPWTLDPTEVPDLPDETMELIGESVKQQANIFEQQMLASGLQIDRVQLTKLVNDYYQEQLDKAKEDLKKEAKERCERAAKEIRDQNQEGGWEKAFKDYLWNFVRMPFGVIKGPILTKKPKTFWKYDERSGEYTLVTEDVLVHDVYAPSVFNIFPSRGMKSVHDGDIIEIHELSKQSLSNLIGVPGYSEQEIRAVLSKYEKGDMKAKWFTIDDETSVNQLTKDKVINYPTSPPTANTPSETNELIFAMEFYGTASGKMLLDWGMTEAIDPEKQYQVNCWKIDQHVIKAVINPDPLGRKPYHISSWAKNPDWIIGEGLLEFAAPIEDALNAIGRALINNIAVASGPMCEIDRDRVDTKTPIYPWRQIESTSMQMKTEGPAVVYYQPQMHAGELVQAWQHFAKVLDEMTVPAYAQGASQSGVTAGTATVFTQLLAAASRSIKAVVSNTDADIITPYNQMCYDNLMKFSEDSTIKGDARVVAKGVSGLQAREQAAQRKVEYLQIVANPTYQQILGAKNIGSILAQIAKSNDLQLPDLQRLEGDDSVEAVIQQMLMAQAGVDPMQENGQVANGGGEAAKAQALNPDGSKAGVVNAS